MSRPCFTRRDLLRQTSSGFGMLALRGLMAEPGFAGLTDDARVAHHLPRAKHVIFCFMSGGVSQVDSFDPKPELTRYSGTDFQGDIHYSFVKRASKKLLGSPWKFTPHGQCGIELSELLPHLAEIVDDICLIRSMHTGANGHEVSIRYFHSGIPGVLGRPTLGSWLVYGLGCETQDLPAYLVLTDPGGHPVDGVNNWSNGFMPALFQGTLLRPREPRILNLDAPPHLRGSLQAQNLQFLQTLNRRHLERHAGESDLEARIASFELAARMQSYELAFRMQASVPELMDFETETEATQQMYGLDLEASREFGTQCLAARRMVEKGVRFVQLYHGAGSAGKWDAHNEIKKRYDREAPRVDKPIAGLLSDLKQRGLLEDTIVWWGAEFGRTPYAQDRGTGRDHNPDGFTVWLAGGGLKPGFAYGSTDEFGHAAVQKKMHMHDLHATLLHALGIDHLQLTYRYSGRDFRLTDVHGEVVHELFS